MPIGILDTLVYGINKPLCHCCLGFLLFTAKCLFWIIMKNYLLNLFFTLLLLGFQYGSIIYTWGSFSQVGLIVTKSQRKGEKMLSHIYSVGNKKNEGETNTILIFLSSFFKFQASLSSLFPLLFSLTHSHVRLHSID